MHGTTPCRPRSRSRSRAALRPGDRAGAVAPRAGGDFGLSISEGALCNILARAGAPLSAAARHRRPGHRGRGDRQRRNIGAGENAMGMGVCRRIRGAAGHPSQPGRRCRARGVRGHRPRIWVSDSWAAQRGHADLWQMCLAHLLRDTQYAIDCGDEGFSVALRWLLLRAIAIGRRPDGLRDSTLAQISRRPGSQAGPRARSAPSWRSCREVTPAHRPRSRTSVRVHP